MSFYCFSREGRGGSPAAVCSWLRLMTVCKGSYPLWVMMCTLYELTRKSPMKCGFSHVLDSKCEQVVLFLKSVWILLENRPTGRIQDFRPRLPPSHLTRTKHKPLFAFCFLLRVMQQHHQGSILQFLLIIVRLLVECHFSPSGSENDHIFVLIVTQTAQWKWQRSVS